MLYNKIRYAETIRKLYRLRNLLAHNRRPDIGARLGYQKYSKRYYIIKEKLKEEKILDREDRFIESPANRWIVELPTMIDDKKELRVLGFPSTFKVYLALFFKNSMTFKEIVIKLGMSERTAYTAIRRLENSFLIINKDSLIHIDKNSEIYDWLFKYVDACITQADTEDNISILFDCVPAYIDGPQAYYINNYEPGRPVGPSDMIIRTYEPYENFWEYVRDRVRYFAKFPKRIVILPAIKDTKIIWVNGIPYNKNATEVF